MPPQKRKKQSQSVGAWLGKDIVWSATRAIAAVGVLLLGIASLLWIDRRQLAMELRQPQLACTTEWHIGGFEEATDVPDSDVNALYATLFTAVNRFLERNPDSTYLAALDEVLPISTELPPSYEASAVVTIFNEGEMSESLVRLIVDAEDWTIVGIDEPVNVPCKVERGGQNEKALLYECADLMSQQGMQITVSFGADQRFSRRLQMSRATGFRATQFPPIVAPVGPGEQESFPPVYFGLPDPGVTVEVWAEAPLPADIAVFGAASGRTGRCATSSRPSAQPYPP